MCGLGRLLRVLLERDQELKLLADLLAGVGSSGGKVVLVRGEAGIGKSSLVETFARAHEDGAHMLLGSCDDLLTPQPLGPFWDIARREASLFQLLETGDLRAMMETLLGLLSRKLRPTVLAIDDTQWADEATLDVIMFLGRRIARTNGVLIITYRDGPVDIDHPLRQVIGELPPNSVVRVHLDRLSAEAVSTMVQDTDLDLDAVLSLTSGNPLFVAEVVAAGVDTVPLSVQDSVLARASKITHGARRVLELVSVSPGDLERSLIDEVLDATQEELAKFKDKMSPVYDWWLTKVPGGKKYIEFAETHH